MNSAPLSSAGMTQAHRVPFITAVGGLESDEFKRQNTLITQSWKTSHREDVALPQANHLTICDAFGTPGHPLCDTSIGLIAAIK